MAISCFDICSQIYIHEERLQTGIFLYEKEKKVNSEVYLKILPTIHHKPQQCQMIAQAW